MSRILHRSLACRCRQLLVSRGFGGGMPIPEHSSSSIAGCNSSSKGFPSVAGWVPSLSSRIRSYGSSAVNSDDPDFDPTEARSAPSEKITRLVDEISSLTLLEVSDLTTLLKKKLGLGNMPMMPMMGGMMPGQGAGGGAAPAAEEKKVEKTAFDVRLEKFDAAAKIKIIKEVRTFTSLGLKEAKELVEKIPALLKKGVTKDEATQIIEKIKAAGGTAVME
ncbi:unnamed protein product [Calypogeia fissa]